MMIVVSSLPLSLMPVRRRGKGRGREIGRKGEGRDGSSKKGRLGSKPDARRRSHFHKSYKRGGGGGRMWGGSRGFLYYGFRTYPRTFLNPLREIEF